MQTTYYRLAATFFLLLAIGLELNHSFIRQVAWKGFELAANFSSFPLLAAWGLSISSLWSAKAVLKPWLVLGIFFLVTHGIVISTGGNGLGAAYIFCGWIAGVCSGLAHYTSPRARPQVSQRPHLRVAS